MGKGRKPAKRSPEKGRSAPSPQSGVWATYRRARQLALEGDFDEARSLYEELAPRVRLKRLNSLVHNDLAALTTLAGDLTAAEGGFRRALELNPKSRTIPRNLAALQAAVELEPAGGNGEVRPVPSQVQPEGRCKVAVLSFLFNWPSTGGGILHTIELVRFLSRAGYDVKHIFARNLPWGVGRVEQDLPYRPQPLEFDDRDWNMPEIQRRFHAAVGEYDPDYVIITDSWNSKPLLAEAVGDYPYLLRLQASECLCPLNNLRLFPDGGQCPTHQFASPETCVDCLSRLGRFSGALHQAERAISGVGSAKYPERLKRAFRNAAAVLVVDPLTEAMISPYCQDVRVVTSGFDAARFPWPWSKEPPRLSSKATILMASLVEDPMKGFTVLHDACRRLWARRQDFELLATGEPAGRVDDFTRFLGWLSQDELPRHLRAADMVVLPPLGAEALGRTAVEAMAVGRPVIASRIGGLPYTVAEGAGLLFEPGNAEDLAGKIEILLENAALRQQMGQIGRQRFEEHYTWDVIIERHYKPLMPLKRAAKQAAAPQGVRQ